MKALLVQPPFTQLNAPYPAIHYLSSFLRSRGIETRAVDHSIELYRAIFSREGIKSAFEAARRKVDEEENAMDDATSSQLERYLSYEDLYLEWIDGLVAFLSGRDPAFAHRVARAVELPIGMRAEAFLEARRGKIGTEDSRGLATAMLEDLGDLVSYSLDPSFATVRYGERIAQSASSFASVRDALNASPLLRSAYAPILAAEWSRGKPNFLLVSVPFPGCLLGALACCKSARLAFGDRTRIVLGGGYVSTELRDLRDSGIFDYCDYLSFDAGYGSLASILEVESGAPRERLYKTMYRGEDGAVVRADIEGKGDPSRREEEDRQGSSIAPDYVDVDFSAYLQVVDSDNPMHRLWSDSPWLKYRLAQGCYWRRCSFCDTELEYVSRFAVAQRDVLLAAAGSAAERSGLYGLHFVDEAMPMAALLAFAEANRARVVTGKRPFHYWGNVRFDGSWTLDRCEYLAASGLVAVSGGIEIATESGLEMTDKGFDLAGLVRTLVAMKRSGLLVHAYLIYGFPGQSRSDIADSAEVCRQLFASGLVDSAFWHRFVLTRHSRMYADWKAGKRPALMPIDRPWDFANNDLGFDGEEAFDDFDGPLSSSLEAWMRGERLDEPYSAEGRRAISVRPDLVEGLVTKAQADLEASRKAQAGSGAWIAGIPIARRLSKGASRLAWTYRGEARELELPEGKAVSAQVALTALGRSGRSKPFAELAAELSLNEKALDELRNAGLVFI
jgi:hypothetical protein